MQRFLCKKCGKTHDPSHMYVCYDCGAYVCEQCTKEELCPHCYSPLSRIM